jgi:hypothetical protein
VNPENLVVVSSPKNIINEWRLVISQGEIIAASQYRDKFGKKYISGADDKVLDYAKNVLIETCFEPDPVWVLDICEKEDGSLKIVEIGIFSCAGLYACDMSKIVENVSSVALKLIK